jgi:outer membrane lipoprotein SlyB
VRRRAIVLLLALAFGSARHVLLVLLALPSTLIGGVAGALVGRSIDTEGDRTTGTVLGAAAGALVGHSIDKNSARCR